MAARVPRVTTKNSPNSSIGSPKKTVLGDCLNHVGTAGWGESTIRSQPGADQDLIKSHNRDHATPWNPAEPNKKMFHERAPDLSPYFFGWRAILCDKRHKESAISR